jgi:predicted Ser/Thr protein kinase
MRTWRLALPEMNRHSLALVKEEYEDIVKNEVQRAIAADEDALTRLCGNYVDNVKAYTQREKVKNKYTGHTEEPDERLMRSIGEKTTSHKAARTCAVRASFDKPNLASGSLNSEGTSGL